MSSIQSVPGQPEAAPDSTPRHHGAAALDLLSEITVCSASQVAGGVVASVARVFGSNQIRPLTAVLMNTPTCLPLTLPSSTNGAAVSEVYVGTSMTLPRSTRLSAHVTIWPGPGRPARSGRTPDATPVVRTVLRSRVPVYLTEAPV